MQFIICVTNSYKVDKMSDDKTKQNSQVESILVLTLIETRQHALGCPLIAQQFHVVTLICQKLHVIIPH